MFAACGDGGHLLPRLFISKQKIISDNSRNEGDNHMRKAAAVFLGLLLSLTLTSCGYLGETTPKYVKKDNGYALEKYGGSSTTKSFTVSTYKDMPVTELMDFSISNSDYLEEIFISKNITKISLWAISNCQKLKNISVDSENPSYTSVEGVLYTKDLKTLLVFPAMNATDYVVPEGVEVIGENAFYKCNKLLSVKLPDSLKKISDRGFQKCESLQKLKLPEGLELIGRDAVSYCPSIKEMIIPKSVTTLGDFAFFASNGIQVMLPMFQYFSALQWE